MDFNFGSLASSLMGTGSSVDQAQLQQLLQKLKNQELTTAARTGKPTEAPGTDSSSDSKPTTPAVAPVQPHKESWLKGAIAGFLNPEAAASTYFDRGTVRRNLAAQREHTNLGEADKDARDLKAMSTALNSGGTTTPEALLAAAKSAAALKDANEFVQGLGAQPFQSNLGRTTALRDVSKNEADVLKNRVDLRTDSARLRTDLPETTAKAELSEMKERGLTADANIQADVPFFDATARREAARAGAEQSGLTADTTENFRNKGGAQALAQLRGMETEEKYTTAKRSKEQAISDVVEGVPEAQAKADRALADLKAQTGSQDLAIGARTPEQLAKMQKLSAEIESKIVESKLATSEVAFVKDKTTMAVLSKVYDPSTGVINFEALNNLQGNERLVALRALEVLGWVRSSDLEDLNRGLFGGGKPQQNFMDALKKWGSQGSSTNTTSIPLSIIDPNKG